MSTLRPASPDAGWSQEALALQPGAKVFRRFELRRFIGRGRLSRVWLAEDLAGGTGREVALRFVPDAVRLNPAAFDTLHRRTSLNLQIVHENLPRTWGYHQQEGLLAVAEEASSGLECGAGPTACSVEDVALWLRGIVSALSHVQVRTGYCHGQLLPRHVIRNEEGHVHVLGFLSAGAALMDPAPTPDRDIAAIGALAYEWLTGEPVPAAGVLAPGASVIARREALGFAEPLPQWWNEVITACLSPDPAERPPEILALDEALGLGLSERVHVAAFDTLPESEAAQAEAEAYADEPLAWPEAAMVDPAAVPSMQSPLDFLSEETHAAPVQEEVAAPELWHFESPDLEEAPPEYAHHDEEIPYAPDAAPTASAPPRVETSRTPGFAPPSKRPESTISQPAPVEEEMKISQYLTKAEVISKQGKPAREEVSARDLAPARAEKPASPARKNMPPPSAAPTRAAKSAAKVHHLNAVVDASMMPVYEEPLSATLMNVRLPRSPWVIIAIAVLTLASLGANYYYFIYRPSEQQKQILKERKQAEMRAAQVQADALALREKQEQERAARAQIEAQERRLAEAREQELRLAAEAARGKKQRETSALLAAPKYPGAQETLAAENRRLLDEARDRAAAPGKSPVNKADARRVAAAAIAADRAEASLPRVVRVPLDEKTIQAALDNAAAGDTVEIRAGTYNETIVAKEGVNIAGEGSDRVTIRADYGRAALKAKGVANVSITGVTFEQGPLAFGAVPPEGKPEAVVSLENANVEIYLCSVLRGAGDGVLLRGGSPILRQTEIAKHNGAGVRLAGAGSTPALRNNMIHDNHNEGVLIEEGCASVMESNWVERNGGDGVVVRGSGTSAKLSSNTMRNNNRSGLVFRQGATGAATENTLEGNREHGILAIDAGSAPTLTDNTCSRNQFTGLAALNGAAFAGNTNTTLDANGTSTVAAAESGMATATTPTVSSAALTPGAGTPASGAVGTKQEP